MTAWKRWQDYSTIVFGVALFATPFVFSDTLQATATTTAYILGVLLVLGGLLAATFVFGFTAVTAIAWAAWVVGVLTIVSAGSLLLGNRGRRPTLA